MHYTWAWSTNPKQLWPQVQGSRDGSRDGLKFDLQSCAVLEPFATSCHQTYGRVGPKWNSQCSIRIFSACLCTCVAAPRCMHFPMQVRGGKLWNQIRSCQWWAMQLLFQVDSESHMCFSLIVMRRRNACSQCLINVPSRLVFAMNVDAERFTFHDMLINDWSQLRACSYM